MKSFNDIQTEFNTFHKDKAIAVISSFSPIAGDQFPGEFNVSGFHNEILSLTNETKSLWGIDRCLRIQEIPDCVHSFVFHMGIYAKSVNLKGSFIDPFKDERFHNFQKEIIKQFLELLAAFNVDLEDVEVTCLDGVTVGGTTEGRDRILKRTYEFPADIISKEVLKDTVKLFPVRSLANVDINPVEGALVGPRLEVAYRGVEIGTIVFNCFKVHNGNLVPINYVAGYAVGVERLTAALNEADFMGSISRYTEAYGLLSKKCKAVESSLFKKERYKIIFGTEALAQIPAKLSDHQKEKVRIMKKELSNSLNSLGISPSVANDLVSYFSSK